MTTDPFASPGAPPTRPEPLVVRGRYQLPIPGGDPGKRVGWTRATTFAKSISDTYRLNMWSRRMVAKGLALRPDLHALVASTPLEDRDALDKLTERAAEAAGSTTAAGLGTALHAFAAQWDTDSLVSPFTGSQMYDINAYFDALGRHGLVAVPGLVERTVVCQRFGVAGTLDRIVRVVRDEYDAVLPSGAVRLSAGDLVVMDLKTGRDLSYGWPEIAVQLALYANADAMWEPTASEYSPMPKVRDDVAIVAHIPVGRATCHLYDVDIRTGLAGAELCADVRAWRGSRNIAIRH